MFPYWLLFSIFAAGSLEYRRRIATGRQNFVLLGIAAVFTALMVGLRHRVGGDWGNYEALFESIRFLNLDTAISLGDPGYSGLNWAAHAFGFEIWFVNLVCGAIFSWGLFRFARQQPNPWLAVLVAVPYLVIVVAMGYTRQAVAIGIVLAGLASLDRSASFIRFSIYVLLAAAFHKSAVIVLPLAALAATRNKILIILVLLMLGGILYFLFVSSAIDVLMAAYIEPGYQSEGAAIRVAMNIPPALLFLRFQQQMELSPSQVKLWRNFAWAALFTLVALFILPSSTAVDRLALYLIPLQMFVLSRMPQLFRGTREGNPQVVVAVIAYSAIIQLVWLNFAANALYWVPYRIYPLS